jgi:uncharacterized linocin/CFP29 family protein
MTWRDRENAPFTQEAWDAIDGAVRAAAEEVRAARRMMEVIGPLGFGARGGVAEDRPASPTDENAIPHVHVPVIQAMPVIHRTFTIGARSIEAFLGRGEPLSLTEAAEAARQVARLEERLLVEGNAAAGVRGLLQQEGAVELAAGDWSDPGRAADDLLAALARLDEAGRHGPYAAAVSPSRYYQLLRPHPASGVTPLAQLEPAFAGGIFKAPTLRNAALVVMRSASGPRAVLGEELTVAYDGREGIFHRLSLVESITLLPGVAGSVAVIRG